MKEIAIGIDPGTNTGFAVWNITVLGFVSGGGNRSLNVKPTTKLKLKNK